ncbi:MAG: thioredoxin family protein [Kofleriaceae bacterium]
MLAPGRVVVRLGWLGTYVHTEHDDVDEVVDRGVIDIVHDQTMMVTEGRLALDAGITERFAASLMLPVRVVSTSIRYRDAMGSEVSLVRPGIHHRNETLVGIADPIVLGALTGTLGSLRATVRIGASLPLGRTEDDPFALGDMGRPHQHIQMGTGTVAPVVAFEIAHAAGRWRVGGFAFTQQVVYENAKRFRAGDRYAAGLELRRRVAEAWSVRGSAELQAETAERWRGVVHTDDGNRGRVDVIVGAGGTWSASKRLSFELALKIPIVTHVVGGQLSMPMIAEVGASWAFGADAAQPAGHQDGHDHDHGDHDHDHGDHGHGHAAHDDGDGRDEREPGPIDSANGLDVADLGAPGEAVDLVPIAGRVTIFDFWAPWCEPCKKLEPALIAMARAHPELVAIRRINVVDWDSPAVARYLTPGGFSLPHVKVFDCNAAPVLEQSSGAGDLAGLVSAVQAIVDAAAANGCYPPGASRRRALPRAPRS